MIAARGIDRIFGLDSMEDLSSHHLFLLHLYKAALQLAQMLSYRQRCVPIKGEGLVSIGLLSSSLRSVGGRNSRLSLSNSSGLISPLCTLSSGLCMHA